MVRSTGLDRGLSDKRPHECGNCSGHRVSGPAVDIGGSISKGGRGIEALFCGKPSLDGGSSPEGSSTRVPSYSKHSPYSSTPPHTPVGGGVVWVLYSTVNSIGGVLGGGEYWSRFFGRDLLYPLGQNQLLLQELLPGLVEGTVGKTASLVPISVGGSVSRTALRLVSHASMRREQVPRSIFSLATRWRR
jgi:hypothetical protein